MLFDSRSKELGLIAMSEPDSHSGPIFIVGAPRSGTTMLQYMLRSHPRLSLPTGESHFFIPLHRRAAEFGDLSARANIRKVLEAMYTQSAEFLETDLHGLRFDIERLADDLHSEGRHTVRDIVAGLFEKNAAGEGKARWGDKTPYYVLQLPRIFDWFPDAQVIHLIRDGRDVALSLFARAHDFAVYNTYHAAKYWEQYVTVGAEHGRKLGPERYMELRYEDILDDQRGSMSRVCDFLGEEFQESVIDFKKAGNAGKTPLVQESVRQANQEKWRKKMTQRQIEVFESAAGSTLKAFGYRTVTDCHSLPLAIRAAFRLHNKIRKKAARIIRADDQSP